ncbi:hypothetical protein [uncultured Pseudokineococcus sp.]|uniref:hypothetical protein n=1 Tax=uncultured Pseudokineococcus sp. TaxID=1642928 RepID=UPI002618ADA4|nr:hypothetical protein [uncultured Pseudokineococcus sp.]
MTSRAPLPDLDGERPLRSALRLLRPHRRGVAAAVACMAVKETPVWLMPVVTGRVVDVLVAGGPLRELLGADGRYAALERAQGL